MENDTRPRVDYTLPDGRIVPIIFDHEQNQPLFITFQLKGGQVVQARKTGHCAWCGEGGQPAESTFCSVECSLAYGGQL